MGSNQVKRAKPGRAQLVTMPQTDEDEEGEEEQAPGRRQQGNPENRCTSLVPVHQHVDDGDGLPTDVLAGAARTETLQSDRCPSSGKHSRRRSRAQPSISVRNVPRV